MHELITLRRRLRALGLLCLAAIIAAAWGWMREGTSARGARLPAEDVTRLEKRMARHSHGDRMRALRRLTRSGGEQAAATAIALFRSAKSHRLRLAAIAQLGRIGTESALRELEEIFEVGSPLLAPAIIAAIGDNGGEGAERWLLEQLDDGVPRWRRALVSALGELSSPASVEVLAKLARNPEEMARTTAIRALGSSGRQEALATLSQLLKDPNRSIQRGAVASLGSLGLSQARDVLVRIVEEARGTLRAPAIAALANYDDAHVRDLLARKTRDADPMVAAAAVRALGRSDAALAQQALASALGSPSSEVRMAAARALAASGDPGARDALAGMLDDPQHNFQAASELAKIGDPEARQTLLDAVGSGGRTRAVAALAALSSLEGAEVEKSLEVLVQTGPSYVRGQALTELVRRRGRKARPMLERLAREGSPRTRGLALRQLVGQVGPGASAKTRALIREAAWSRDGTIASAGVEGLAKLGPQGREAMVGLLRDGPTSSYYAVIQQLAQLGGPRARDALFGELKDPKRAQRAYGVGYALGKMRDPETRQMLRNMVNDTQAPADARKHALQALGQQGDVEALKAAATHQDEGTARRAMRFLARTGGAEAERALVDASQAGSSVARRSEALRALGSLGTPQATQSLKQALHDKELFDTAASSLANVDTASAQRALRDRYASADSAQRERLLGYVSRSSSAGAREMMEQGLSDPDPKVAAAAAGALVSSAGTRVHERIEALLHSPEVAVRKAVAQRLRWRNSPLYWRHKALVDQTLGES